MSKYGGNLGENGSVSWMFEKLGQIIIESNSVDEEKLFNDALDSGAEDFTRDESDFLITSKPPLTADIAEKLEHKGYNILSSKIEMVPKNIVDINDSESSKLITLMEQLEEHDDVQNIASNFQINFSNTKP
jgi:transcriptional/translational regulatory protein YebC/TACO1